MPSETFKNLSQNKKNMIMLAAKHEFSQVPFHEASINHIIKEAGISRGSFYMYFENKEDLYMTLAEHQMERHFKFLFQTLKENRGDLFMTYKSLYDILYKKISKHKKANFEKNMLMNMNFHSNSLMIRENKVHYHKYSDQFLNAIDAQHLVLNTTEDLLDIIDMLTLLLVHSLVISLKEKEKQPIISQRYKRQVDIIECSVKKGR